MSESEKELIMAIRNHNNPQKALVIAIEIISDYLRVNKVEELL